MIAEIQVSAAHGTDSSGTGAPAAITTKTVMTLPSGVTTVTYVDGGSTKIKGDGGKTVYELPVASRVHRGR